MIRVPAQTAASPASPQASVVRRSPFLRVQPKLTVGAPDDEYEREADRVAEQVTRGAAPPVSPAQPRVQRACACGGTCASCSKDEELQRSASSRDAVPGEAPEDVHQALSSSGRPLDSGVRERLEPRFGMDFSRVRIHTDDRAAESARAVSAHAYTVGPQIVFAPGQYAPGTPGGDRLLAHELTHVVQQSGSSGVVQRLPVQETQREEAGRAGELR